MLLLEDLCNRSPDFRALVVREETPSPHSVGCPTDGLPELTTQQCVVTDLLYGVVFLLPVIGVTALSGGPFCLGIPHHTRVETLLLEVHPLC